MEGSGVGGWGEPGGGQGLDRDERWHRSPWALHAEGCCGGLPGGRGDRGRWRGLRLGEGRGLTQAGEPPGARPARGLGDRGWAGAAPAPPPRARPRRPALPPGRPALPAPSLRRPPPEPSPGNASSPTASSWRGRGPGRRPGEEGTGGGGAESEAGPGARRGAGGGRRRWRKEPRGRGSPGGGKAAAAAAAAAAAGAGPFPASPHPPHRTPLPSPAPLRPLGRRSPSSRPPRPASALGETEAQKGVQWPLGEFGPLSHWPPNAASTPPPPASSGAAPEGQPHPHWLTPQTCARVRLARQYPTRRRAVAPGGGAQIIHRARILVVTYTQNANPPRLLRKARESP